MEPFTLLTSELGAVISLLGSPCADVPAEISIWRTKRRCASLGKDNVAFVESFISLSYEDISTYLCSIYFLVVKLFGDTTKLDRGDLQSRAANRPHSEGSVILNTLLGIPDAEKCN